MTHGDSSQEHTAQERPAPTSYGDRPMRKKTKTHTDSVEAPFEPLHAFRDNTGRFAVDQLLREWGFIIHSRKRNREAIWRLYDKLYTHSQAIKEVSFRQLEDAVEREYWYKLGLFE